MQGALSRAVLCAICCSGTVVISLLCPEDRGLQIGKKGFCVLRFHLQGVDAEGMASLCLIGGKEVIRLLPEEGTHPLPEPLRKGGHDCFSPASRKCCLASGSDSR